MSTVLQVTSTLTPEAGRFVTEARERFLVTDSTAARGGKAQAWLAGELLLGALSTCAVSSVTAFAREKGYALEDTAATLTSTRHPSDETRYEKITLSATTRGISQEQAKELVSLFIGSCPVFGTVSRGGQVDVLVNEEPFAY